MQPRTDPLQFSTGAGTTSRRAGRREFFATSRKAVELKPWHAQSNVKLMRKSGFSYFEAFDEVPGVGGASHDHERISSPLRWERPIYRCTQIAFIMWKTDIRSMVVRLCQVVFVFILYHSRSACDSAAKEWNICSMLSYRIFWSMSFIGLDIWKYLLTSLLLRRDTAWRTRVIQMKHAAPA